MILFTKEMIKPLYYGSLMTACGGGEYSDHLPIIVEKMIDRNGPVRCLGLEELGPSDTSLTTGIMGSMLEASLQTGEEGRQVVERFCSQLQIDIQALFTIEASSLNVLYPILVSSLMGIPIIDGDCMGRAFPEFQMTTAEAAGEKIAPMSILTPKGAYYFFEDMENLLFEVQAREIVSHDTGIAYFAGFPLDTARIRSIMIPGTLSFNYAVGSCFMGVSSYAELSARLLEVTKNSIYGSAVELFTGTVSSISSSTDGGRSWLNVRVEGYGSYQNSEFSILSQNEALIAFRDNAVAAMVPDLITLVDLRTLKPFSITAIHEDMRIAVIGIPAPVRLKTRSMLNVLGPACFGYNKEYIPLENIYSSWYFS